MIKIGMVGLILVGGCSKKDDYGMPPPPDNTIDSGVTKHDAPVGNGSDAAPPDGTVIPPDAFVVDGRVCLLTDPRNLRSCADHGAAGLTVRLDGVMSVVTLTDDGRFQIQPPSSTTAEWTIVGDNIVTSHELFANYQIPAITTTMYNAMLVANNIVLAPGEASLLAEVRKDNAGHAGCFGDETPTSVDGALYDGPTQNGWTRSGTGSNGAIWAPGVAVGVNGTMSLKVTPPLPEAPVTISAHVFAGDITFLTVAIQ